MQAPWVGNPPEEECSGVKCEECGEDNAKIMIHDKYSNEYWFCNEDCLCDFLQFRPTYFVRKFLDVYKKDA